MTPRLPLLAMLAGLSACDGARTGGDAPLPTAMAPGAPRAPACPGNDVRPATGAPAEGLWLWEGARHRVAAIVGPAQAAENRPQVTRRVETLEAREGADTIRFVADSAAVGLRFVPPFERPATAYAVGPLVLLASYEPCPPGPRDPLIRYVRHDDGGRVLTDVMLQRASAAP